nr:MAG TPA: hypothetical protein [Caudoviricetes sp.]
MEIRYLVVCLKKCKQLYRTCAYNSIYSQILCYQAVYK